MRLFVAIPVAAEAVRALAALAGRLRTPDDGLRWTAPAGWHVTLQFLGASTAVQCACVQDALRRLRSGAVPIALEEPELFERSGALVVGVRLAPELAKLQRQVVAATAPCGYAAEDRPYRPHLTLARSRGDRRVLAALKHRLHGAVSLPAFTAREFVLYESFLEPGGARYEACERFELAAKS